MYASTRSMKHFGNLSFSQPSRMDTEGTYIYGGRRNLIKSFAVPHGPVLNVKRYHISHGHNRLIYSWGLRIPKGLRAWRYPAVLKAKGISTLEAVAYLEERKCGLLGQSYFVSIQSPYSHRLYELAEAQPELYEPLARALARFTAHMHDEGVLHCDYSPGNILWDTDEAGHFVFTIVDINRMHFGQVNMKAGCRNFRRLWGPERLSSLSWHANMLWLAVSNLTNARNSSWTTVSVSGHTTAVTT